MRTLTITVQGHDKMLAAELAAARRINAGEGYQGEVYSFETIDLLFETITPRRWALIWKLKEIGPSTLRGLARALERDVKRVHQDVTFLLEEGIVEWGSDKRLLVPYADIRIAINLADTVAA